MGFCPQCGTKFESGDQFCENCGYNLARPTPPAGAPAEDDADKTVIMPPRTPTQAARAATAGARPRDNESQSSRPATPPPASGGGSAAGNPFVASAARQQWFGWLLARVKNILFSPKTEWPAIEAEAETVSGLYQRYIIPLQAAASVAGLIGSMFLLMNIGFGMGIVGGIVSAAVSFALSLVLVFVMALLIDALAPSFGGQKSQMNALKLMAYAYTPSYVGGLLMILPFLGPLMILFAFYGIYLLYLGLPPLMKCPKEKAPVYTVVVVVVSLVLSLVIGMVGAGVAGIAGLGGMAAVSMDESKSPLGKETTERLEQMAKQMEAAGKKMEAAEKSGDQAAVAAAASEALGAALSGGRKVEAVDFRELKALLPDKVVGMKRTEAGGEKGGMGDLNVSTAEARYQGDPEGSLELKITDMGGAGLAAAGLAAWSMVEVDKETESGRERTGKLDGRPFHEEYNSRDRSGEFALVVAQRFLVEARGDAVELDTLKRAVTSVDLRKLEGMKDAGVGK